MKNYVFASSALLVVTAFAAENHSAVPQKELIESSCSLMVSSVSDPSIILPAPDLSVLHPPTSQPHLSVDLDTGLKLEAVVCWRSIADLGPNDDWAVSAGVPLYIKENSDGAARVLVLELTEVGYRARQISGAPLSSAQARHVRSLIGTFNERHPGPPSIPPKNAAAG